MQSPFQTSLITHCCFMRFSRASDRISFNLTVPFFLKFFLMILLCLGCHQYRFYKSKYFTSLEMCTFSINNYHQNVEKNLISLPQIHQITNVHWHFLSIWPRVIKLALKDICNAMCNLCWIWKKTMKQITN